MSGLPQDDAPDAAICTLEELCQGSALQEGFIVDCVELGVVHIVDSHRNDWRFSARAVMQLRKAWRLYRDLDLQIADLPLVLELLDERDRLHQQIFELRCRLAKWEDV